jgi:hypothetical protein
MKIASTLTVRADQVAELEIIAGRLHSLGFDADVVMLPKVTKMTKPEAMLRTNAQPRTLRKARMLSVDGNLGALNAMMAQVIGKTKDMNLPPCEVKTK